MSTWSCCLKCLNLFQVQCKVFCCPSASSSDNDQNNPSTQINNNQSNVPWFNMFTWSVSEELPSLLRLTYILFHSITHTSSLQAVHSHMCVYVRVYETTGGHTAPLARGGHSLRQSCRCRPLCGYPMSSSGWRHNPAGRPLLCLQWWWAALIVRAACPLAPTHGKKTLIIMQLWQMASSCFLSTLLWDHEYSATEQILHLSTIHSAKYSGRITGVYRVNAKCSIRNPFMARIALIPEWNYWYKFSSKFFLVEAKVFSLKTTEKNISLLVFIDLHWNNYKIINTTNKLKLYDVILRITEIIIYWLQLMIIFTVQSTE